MHVFESFLRAAPQSGHDSMSLPYDSTYLLFSARFFSISSTLPSSFLLYCFISWCAFSRASSSARFCGAYIYIKRGLNVFVVECTLDQRHISSRIRHKEAKLLRKSWICKFSICARFSNLCHARFGLNKMSGVASAGEHPFSNCPPLLK